MTLNAFLSQGGYALFVWGSYGMTMLLLLAEIISLRYRRRDILSRIHRLNRLRAEETDDESQA